MSIYIIPRKIKRFEIFQPRTTLKTWYSQQVDKPDILFNASLYKSISAPCGTVWNDGKLVNNAGSGFGFGTTDKKTVEFGKPWDKAWYDYITGYYGIVQNGKAIDPPWKDTYVFDKALSRIAFGKLKDGSFGVFCENGKTITEFAADAVKQGFVDLCNLDGGGSRALLWFGTWMYTSTRTPYNAIAIWLENDTSLKDVSGLKVKCTQKTQVYDKNGNKELARYIDAGDICVLDTTITSAIQAKITYPVSSGTRTAYVKNLENFTIV